MTSKDRRFIYDAVFVALWTITIIRYECRYENLWFDLIHLGVMYSFWVYHIVKFKNAID